MKSCNKHEWEIIVKTYAPPMSNLSGVSGNDMDTMNRMVFGCTTVLMQCSICKGLHKEEMLGKEEEKTK